jgi:two-component system sensor histidine kinase KdpD
VEALGGVELLVSVTDDGPGMCAEPRAARPGRGLGLGICDAIVSAHGGRLEVEDVPGRGARVVFTLPARPEEAS